MSEEPYKPKKIPAWALSAFRVGLDQRHMPDFKCTCRIETIGTETEDGRPILHQITVVRCPLCEAAPDLARYAYALTQRQDLKPDTFDIIIDMMKVRIERLEEAIKEV